MSAGQLVVIPLAPMLVLWFGWRASFFWLGLGVLAIVLPLATWLIRNDPAERDLRPYGATGPTLTAAQAGDARRAGRVGLVEAAQHPQFWLLMATFFVCGYTTNGMVLTHFMPHALEHSFTEFQASTALGIMGAMNVLGTIASGWICDRFGRRGPLATYYLLRGISLIFLVYVWDVSSLHLWAAIYGLNYISTVPRRSSGATPSASCRAGSSSRTRSARRSAPRSRAGSSRPTAATLRLSSPPDSSASSPPASRC
jgi:predicted MFS family arabinose efflux permease